MIFSRHLLLYFFIASLHAVVIDTVWGPHSINDPILEDLLEHPALLRMKEIDQSGPLPYFNSAPFFSRYDHSIGVLALLDKAGGPLKEQVAGLFHDVSHTAFSHIGDHLLFESNHEHSYQDRIHLSFLKFAGVDSAVSSLMTLDELDPDRSEYKALERPHPNLCADRLQYIVHTGVIFNKITPAQANLIINDLDFDGEYWFFKHKEQARIFGELSIYFTKELWGSPWNFVFYECFTSTLKRAIALNLITLEDIKFGTDNHIMEVLNASSDAEIKQGLAIMYNIHDHYMLMPYGDQASSWNVKPKCRAVDPLVQTEHGLERLSSLDQEYHDAVLTLKNWCSTGYGVQLKN